MTEPIDKTLYRVGKALLGEKAGGLITKLRKACGGDCEAALEAIELARTKENPREYVAGIIRNEQPDIAAILKGI